MVPQESKHPGKTIPQDGRTDVAHMHWLGDIRRTEINDHRASRCGGAKEQVLTLAGRAQDLDEGFGPNSEVDEPSPGNRRRLTPLRDIQALHNRSRQLPGVLTPGFRQGHESARLIVAESGVRARLNPHLGQLRVGRDSGHSLTETVFKQFAEHEAESG
jgi:hypothetical protein